MNLADLDIKFPDWKVPPQRSGQISQEAWLKWLEENRRELLRTGQIQKIRNDPLHCPVDARFKW